jgi:hypothetical protein
VQVRAGFLERGFPDETLRARRRVLREMPSAYDRGRSRSRVESLPRRNGGECQSSANASWRLTTRSVLD